MAHMAAAQPMLQQCPVVQDRPSRMVDTASHLAWSVGAIQRAARTGCAPPDIMIEQVFRMQQLYDSFVETPYGQLTVS
jgi:hypothetical protein